MFDFKNASKVELNKKYKEIAKEIGDDQFFTKKELNYLQEVLKEQEQVLAFTSGFMDGNTWLIVLTDKRILFLDKGMIYGLKQHSIPLSKVNSISCATKILFGEIGITEGSKTHKIKNVWKKTVKTFTNKVEAMIDKQEKGNYSSQEKGSIDDPYKELEKLASLKDKGIITEKEFSIKKRKLLQ